MKGCITVFIQMSSMNVMRTQDAHFCVSQHSHDPSFYLTFCLSLSLCHHLIGTTSSLLFMWLCLTQDLLARGKPTELHPDLTFCVASRCRHAPRLCPSPLCWPFELRWFLPQSCSARMLFVRRKTASTPSFQPWTTWGVSHCCRGNAAVRRRSRRT